MSALAVALVALLVAQEPQTEVRVTRPSPGVVKLGDSSRMSIVFQGAVRSADFDLPQVDGLRMRAGGPRRESRQSIINGRFKSSNTLTYTVVITPTREGVFEIPPFTVRADGVEQRTPALGLEVVRDLRGAEHASISVMPSATRVYVHEPLRLAVEYYVNDRLPIAKAIYQRRFEYYDIEIEADWLDSIDGLVPVETEADYPNSMILALNGRPMEVDYTSEYERGGRRFHRFQFERTMLPNRSGTLRLDAPLLRFSVVKGQNVFGQDLTDPYFAYGEPLEIEVLPIPEEGRPSSYSGAVGRFSVSSRLDRTRVKVGNSVRLLFTIEGQGNLEFLRVPELEEVDGFHVLGQRREELPGRVEVTYDLTPLRDDVTAVPGIEWSYFDTTPGVEEFVTVATDPIALEVVPLAEGESLAALPGEERAAVTPGVDDIFDMKALAATPPAPRSHPPGRGLVTLLVLAPWLLCGLLVGWLARRAKSRADVVGQRSRGAEKRFRRALADGVDPGDALVAYLADRLGVADAAVIGPKLGDELVEAGVDEELSREVHGVIEAAVSARYGGGRALEADGAKALVERLAAQGMKTRASTVLGAILVCGLLASSLSAQADPGEAAYRAGDYEEAVAAFSRAAETSDADGRVFYNLGNSLYRLGRLGESLVAYERARLSMPRDSELLANIALVRGRLELGSAEGEPFTEAVADLRASFTSLELVGLCVLFNALAAACLVLGRRSGWLRAIGMVAVVPATALILEVLWLGPSRAPAAIVTARQTDLVSEPREGLDAVLVLREGVAVDVLAAGPSWTRVQVEGRSGYVAAADLGMVE